MSVFMGNDEFLHQANYIVLTYFSQNIVINIFLISITLYNKNTIMYFYFPN